MELSPVFTESYVQYGKDIVATPLHDSLKQKIIELMPTNFDGEEIGAPNCLYSDQLIQKAAKVGKKGRMIVVDPFPLQSRVIKSTGEDYVRQPCKHPVDLVIMKFALHLVPNLQEFLQNVHKRLSDNGIFIFAGLTADTSFPWGEVIQKGFQSSVLKEQVLAKVGHLFDIKVDRKEYHKNVSKESLIGLVKNRGWTNFYSQSEQELQEGVRKIEAWPEDPIPSRIFINAYYLKKVK